MSSLHFIKIKRKNADYLININQIVSIVKRKDKIGLRFNHIWKERTLLLTITDKEYKEILEKIG